MNDQFPEHRTFFVDKKVRLIAYRILDPETLADSGVGPAGFVVYAFVQKTRVGTWRWARDFECLDSVVEAYQTATNPNVPIRAFDEPSQLPPDIRNMPDTLLRACEAAEPYVEVS